MACRQDSAAPRRRASFISHQQFLCSPELLDADDAINAICSDPLIHGTPRRRLLAAIGNRSGVTLVTKTREHFASGPANASGRREPFDSTYGLIAEFDTPAEAIHAAEQVRDAGFRHWAVVTPCAVRGRDRAMGLRNSKVGWFAFLGGVTGYALGNLMIWFMNDELPASRRRQAHVQPVRRLPAVL